MVSLKLNKKITFLIILFSGLILRFYNISFDNLWYDEIISFWVASPKNSYVESFNIHNYIEVAPYTYHFILKIFFKLFGYEVFVGRYMSAIFGVLSILSISYIVIILKYKKAYLFSLFLISFNIFLISYSQEMRVYSMLLFFISLSFIFFLKLFNQEKNYINYMWFIIFSLIAITLHPFALLIFFSFIFFTFLRFIKKKNVFKEINASLVIIGILSMLFYFIFFFYLEPSEKQFFWISQINLKFFTNVFFSAFFGSRLMGGIFLLVLIYLIFYHKKLLLDLKNPSIFLISIITSYFLPIIFSYIIQPVMIPRYFIFVIIPVIILITVLTFELKSKKKIYFITFFLCAATIINMFEEQTFKQFYSDRIVNKPEYTKTLLFIKKSNHINYTLKVEKNMKSITETTNAINNYIDYLNKKIDSNLFYLPLEKIGLKPIWIICPMDIQLDCLLPDEISDYKVLDEKNFNRINIKLIKKI